MTKLAEILFLSELRPYQLEAAKSILNSVLNNRGMTFCVEIARQGGKNELSAQLERLLMILNLAKSENLVKCSPTFKPQTVISMTRLKDCLTNGRFARECKSELGYIIRTGNARTIFLSADKSASVVGHTAHILLEVDEAQDVSKEKYTKDFRPMGSTTNVTTVLYGTTWDDTTLLEETKQTCFELEKKDGLPRCFRYDWQEVVKYNPEYLAYVEAERDRLGENHPLFLTQYCLLPVHGGGRFFSAQQRAQLQGSHSRLRAQAKDKIYVAGIDLAGEAEETDDEKLNSVLPRNDSTVVTIGELDYSSCDDIRKQPVIRIVEQYRWTGKKHSLLYEQLVDILKEVWNCRRVVVDATGVGQPVASFLRQALGSRIKGFTFTSQSKSGLGYNLLGAVDSGRLKMYAGDGSDEYREFWYEVEQAKGVYRPNKTMNFFVDPSRGHDDFLMSLALLVEAAEGYTPRGAKGRNKS
ncbi:MAG: hypothetical protein JW712_13690 [Dehalococcoidales bacterium]|nr:hypothetical protein [Dehalococcoidales bacterium]